MLKQAQQQGGGDAEVPGGQLELAKAWSLSMYQAQASPCRPNSCNLTPDMLDAAVESARSAQPGDQADVLQGLLASDMDDMQVKDASSKRKWQPDGYVHLEVHDPKTGYSCVNDCGGRGSSFSSLSDDSSSSAGTSQSTCQAQDLQHVRQQREQHEQQKHQQQPLQTNSSFWLDLQQLLSTPAVLVFMAQATVMGRYYKTACAQCCPCMMCMSAAMLVLGCAVLATAMQAVSAQTMM